MFTVVFRKKISYYHFGMYSSIYLLQDGGPYYIDQYLHLISISHISANQWTIFYIIGTSIRKEVIDQVLDF